METIRGDDGEPPLAEILTHSVPPKREKPTDRDRKPAQGKEGKPAKNTTPAKSNAAAKSKTPAKNKTPAHENSTTAKSNTATNKGKKPGNQEEKQDQEKKEKRKPPAYLEQERRLVQASEEAVAWVEKKFSTRNRGSLSQNPMVQPFLESVRQWVIQPGRPLAGLVLLREGCLYCERAKEVFQRAEKAVADQYHMTPGLAMYTFSPASQDPGGQEELIAALKQWGVDSFPVLLLMQVGRDGGLETMASIDKDKNTSNPQVWEKFLLATLFPGEAARRQREADKDQDHRLGGMSLGDPGTALFQDDIGRVTPAMLTEHAK